MSREALVQQLKLLKERRRRLAKTNFWAFCLWMDYSFFIDRQSFIEEIADAFQGVFDKKIHRLGVSLPPRGGKSYTTSLYTAWTLGRRRGGAIMRNTHTARLSTKLSNDIKIIMHLPLYQEVFGYIPFVKDAADEWIIQGAKTGVSYFCAGVGGAISGYGCNEVAIIDDSVKDVEQAMSDLQLDKIYNWYVGVHLQRIEKNTPEIHIGTRWSKYDIMGRTEAMNKYDHMIKIPALVNGETFCPAVKTTEQYLEQKNMLPENIWEAELMQQPIELKGTLYPLQNLKRFTMDEIKNQQPEGILAVCDTADEGSDSLCSPVGLLYGEKVFITDVIFTTAPIEETQPLVAAQLDRNKVQRAKFESNNGGKGFALAVKGLISGRTMIEWKQTVTNKHTRILMQSPNVKENIYFRSDIKQGSQYWRFLDELTKYRTAGGNKHDDAADGVTMLSEFSSKQKWGW